MRLFLTILFAAILLLMLAVTIRASLDRSILDVGPPLTSDAWFQATLVDAYLAFFTFYVWVAYKESSWPLRVAWLALIVLLGSMAMALYVLIQLIRAGPDADAARILLRRADVQGHPEMATH